MNDKIDWTKTPEVELHLGALSAADATWSPCVIITGKHKDGRVAGARYRLPQKLEQILVVLDGAKATLRELDATHDMRVVFESD